MAEKQRRYTSEWLEKLRNMTPEEKEAYLEGKVKKGRRQAHLILGSPPKLNMTRQELREMIASEYPGLTLSAQIIKDRNDSNKGLSEPTSMESSSDEKPYGTELPDTPEWIYEMAKRYGEPTVSLDELREMLDKELNGESLSDFLIQDRRKNPY